MSLTVSRKTSNFNPLIPADCSWSIYVSSDGKNDDTSLSIKSHVAVWCFSKTNVILAINKNWTVQCKSNCPDKYKLASVWDAQVSCYCCIFKSSCSFVRDKSSRVKSESWESRRDLIMIIFRPILFLNTLKSQWPLVWMLYKSLDEILFLE